MDYPSILSRAEFATGLLVRSIKVNGYYLLVENCSLNQTQEIDTSEQFIQGGPGQAISVITEKKISGQLSFPLRIDKNNNLEQAAIEILKHAENPINPLIIETNHALSHYNITVEDHATDNNELITLSTMVISSLTINSTPESEIKVTVDFQGMLDSRTSTDFALPDQLDLLGRALSWGDCDISRAESSMRNTDSISVSINNTLETPVFLVPYNDDPDLSFRSDQIHHVGVKAVKWTGTSTELLRKGAELHTHIHGGWMEQENLTIKFGPVTATFITPLFKVAQVPLTPSVMKRTTEWISLVRPGRPLSSGGLFSFA